MDKDREPKENISGGPMGGGVATEFSSSDASTVTEIIVDHLGDMYWKKSYGGQDAFTCLVRTILSQNTSDKASQPAFDSLMDHYRSGDLAEMLADTNHGELADTIRHAGLYNQKAKTIRKVADRIIERFGGSTDFDRYVKQQDPSVVRKELMELKGVGPKTADCVLLFAGGQPGVFPVDTHIHRIYRRLGIAPPDANPEAVREILERDVPPEKCGFGHTASIQFGREYCSARTPVCLENPHSCPLFALCDQIGIDKSGGTITDPADT